jgi:hypothetical protein
MPDGSIGAYFATFRFSFAIFGAASLDFAKSNVDAPEEKITWPSFGARHIAH